MFVAGKALIVDGVRRLPGEPVPEAANWKNLRNYLRSGHVIEVNSVSEEEGQSDGSGAEITDRSFVNTAVDLAPPPPTNNLKQAPEPPQRGKKRRGGKKA